MATSEEQESLLQQFFALSDEYMELFAWLQANAPSVQGTPLEAEVNAVLKAGEEKRGLIDNIKGTLDNVIDFSKTGWGNITDWAKRTMGIDASEINNAANAQLGFLPFLLPAAVVGTLGTGAFALNTWVSGAQETKAKVTQFNKLIEQGYSANAAADIANRLLVEKAQRGTIDKILMVGALGVAAFFLFKFKK